MKETVQVWHSKWSRDAEGVEIPPSVRLAVAFFCLGYRTNDGGPLFESFRKAASFFAVSIGAAGLAGWGMEEVSAGFVRWRSHFGGGVLSGGREKGAAPASRSFLKTRQWTFSRERMGPCMGGGFVL